MHPDAVIHCLGRIRTRAHELIVAELKRLGHTGLAPSHGSILAVLYARGTLPMTALAQAIDRRKNTVTSLVRKLEAAGYVRRLNDPGDSRVCLVALTEKGEAFRNDFTAISDRLLARVWGRMDTSRRATLMAGLAELLDNLS